jgi:hypothetical protein
MQAMKMFTGGQSAGQGGAPQNAFMGMAMGQAAKLFDQQSAQGNTVRPPLFSRREFELTINRAGRRTRLSRRRARWR